jgi:glycosyltransferase involved in cell wall biosynthesis/ADP-heptose:LPS heptosyltransferase
MRIVIDMQGAQTGSRLRGIGRYTLSLAKAIVRNRGRHEIILALSGLFPATLQSLFTEFEDLLPKESIRVWHAMGPVKEFDSANRCRREITEKMREAFLAQLQPDVVLICSLFEGLGDDAVTSIGHLGESFPTTVVLHDLIPLVNPDEHFRSSRIHRDWYSRKIIYLKRSQMLLANSESSRQEALTALDFDPGSVVTISGACDDFFQVSKSAKRAKESVCSALGISKPFVMYIGGADERKNLNRLIMAHAKLPPDVRLQHQLVFVGDMPKGCVREYLKVANDSGLSDRELIFTGYVEDSAVLTLYNTCELFVFPSLHEGLGIPPLEAMACGAPVIGADASSLTEVIGLNEALFDPNSVQAISGKMKQALTDGRFRTRLIEHGLKHCRKFSWDQSAKRALNALERFDPQRQSPVSPFLTIEKTSTFVPRQLKILAIKLDHLGDFLLAIPAFTKLKAKYPFATIDLVVGSWNVSVAEQLGFFDKVFAFDFFKAKSSESFSLESEALENILKILRTYDIAIDFRRQPDGRFLITWTDARLKVAYQTLDEEIDKSIDLTLPYYNDIPFKTTLLNKTSISHQMIALVDALPDNANDFITFPEISERTTREPWTIAIFPKAGNDAREWGLSNFIKLIDKFLANTQVLGINVYFANQSDAAEFTCEPNSRLRIHIGLNFKELTESLVKNEMCIANNSGGGHLASYLGVTTVIIFSGHELPSEWAPQFNNSYVVHRTAPCAPCHGGKRSDCPNDLFCLTEISVTDVYTTVLSALGKYRGKTNVPVVSLQKNTDSIVRELIDSISGNLKGLTDSDLISLSSVISRNHPIDPISFELTCLKPNIEVNHMSSIVEWKGFSASEPEFRWTDGHTSEIRFSCPVDISPSGVLSVVFDTLGKQRVLASFNGAQVYDEAEEGVGIELKIPVTNIQSGMNRLVLTLPDARHPGNGDGRTLGLAVRGLKVDGTQLSIGGKG